MSQSKVFSITTYYEFNLNINWTFQGLKWPHDLAISPDGKAMYIVEIGPNRITKFVLERLEWLEFRIFFLIPLLLNQTCWLRAIVYHIQFIIYYHNISNWWSVLIYAPAAKQQLIIFDYHRFTLIVAQ